MPIGSVGRESSIGFLSTRLIDFGKSLLAKVIGFATAFFHLIGIAFLYRVVCTRFTGNVVEIEKKEEGLCPEALSAEKQALLEGSDWKFIETQVESNSQPELNSAPVDWADLWKKDLRFIVIQDGQSRLNHVSYEISFIPGANAKFSQRDLMICEHTYPLNAEIFSWEETDGVESQLEALFTSYNPNEKHLFMVPSAAQHLKVALFAQIQQWLTRLRFSPLINLLSQETATQYLDGCIEPRSVLGLRHLIHQFEHQGKQFVCPYVRGEAFDIVFPTVPKIQQDLLENWSKDKKDNCLLQIYVGEQKGGQNSWLENFDQAKQAVCATRPLTPLLRRSFADLQRSFGAEGFKQQCIEALAHTSDEKYKTSISQLLEEGNPLISKFHYEWVQSKVLADFPEPFEMLFSKSFWDLIMIGPNTFVKMKQTARELPEVTEREKQVKEQTVSFLDQYLINVAQHEYLQFKQDMQSLEFRVAYTSLSAQFNSLKKTVRENPGKTVIFHMDGTYVGVNGNAGKYLLPAFYKAAHEFEVWVDTNGHTGRVKVVSEVFRDSTERVEDVKRNSLIL